jgi:hypothetical protein
LREDVEDQRRAVEDFAFEDFFQVAALRGGKFVVKDDRVHVVAPAKIAPLAGLALADERGGVERDHFLHARLDDFAAGGRGEFAEFGERLMRVRAVARLELDADEKNPFRPCV